MSDRKTSYSNLLNPCVYSFGKEQTLCGLKQFAAAYPGRIIVSVGSGNGFLELQLVLFDISVICVDPKWNEWTECAHGLDEPFLAPLFPTVEALVKTHPDLVGNCIVFLNWCYPNESDYDFWAIQHLAPLAFWVNFEKYSLDYKNGKPSGSAGGRRFHRFLQETEEKKEHVKVHAMRLTYPGASGPQLNLMMEWWQQFNLPAQPHTLPSVVESLQLNPDPGCVIS